MRAIAKKILYCATVDYHFKAFHLPYMKWFKEQGWEVHVAASGNMNLPYTDQQYDIPIERTPFSWRNVEAYKQLRSIISNNKYSIIHCHTPLGGVLGRMAARQERKHGTKVIYTAHGFHFCKGAPLLNWAVYYPIEKYLSRYTDTLITINQEDYNLAEKQQFKAEKIEHVHGVGVDTIRFKPLEENIKLERRKSLGYEAGDFLLFYAAEFNKNKNQEFLIKSMALLKDEVPNAKLLLSGEGNLLGKCKDMAVELGVRDRIDFLGLRHDIDMLLPICDIAVASSYREGLPVNVMEAMACGLPVVATDNRGHRELVENHKTGWLLDEWDPGTFSSKIKVLASASDMRKQFGMNGRAAVIAKYSTAKVLMKKSEIYNCYMEEQGVPAWAAH